MGKRCPKTLRAADGGVFTKNQTKRRASQGEEKPLLVSSTDKKQFGSWTIISLVSGETRCIFFHLYTNISIRYGGNSNERTLRTHPYVFSFPQRKPITKSGLVSEIIGHCYHNLNIKLAH